MLNLHRVILFYQLPFIRNAYSKVMLLVQLNKITFDGLISLVYKVDEPHS